jgi:DNA-binding transcriptional LysR family regulator
MLTLAKIRGFVAVVEYGSFRKASIELSKSQPALSAQVLELEETLGVTLLTRTTREIRLTRHGQRFLIRAKRILNEIDAMNVELESEANIQHGSVAVGCVPTVATRFPKIIAAYSRRFPEIEVHLVDDAGPALEIREANMELDFYVGPPPHRSSLLFEPMIQDAYVVVFSKMHPFSGRRTIKFDELDGVPLVAMTRGTNIRESFDAIASAHGKTITSKFDVFNLYTLAGMVEAGLGISVVPSMALSVVNSPHLRSARLVAPEISRQIGLVRRRGEALSPGEAAFVTMMKRAFTDKCRAAKRRGGWPPPRSPHA